MLKFPAKVKDIEQENDKLFLQVTEWLEVTEWTKLLSELINLKKDYEVCIQVQHLWVASCIFQIKYCLVFTHYFHNFYRPQCHEMHRADKLSHVKSQSTDTYKLLQNEDINCNLLSASSFPEQHETSLICFTVCNLLCSMS
jgi:hypothetical protein